MSLHTAQAFAWSLATTLMTCIVLIRTDRGLQPRCRRSEFDGDPKVVVHEYDLVLSR